MKKILSVVLVLTMMVSGLTVLLERETVFAQSQTATFYATSSDGQIRALGANWNAVYNAASGTVSSGGVLILIGTDDAHVGGPFACERAGIFFDTSSLSNDAVIVSATLRVYVNSTIGGGAATIRVVSGADLENPLVGTDYGDLRTATASRGTFVGTSVGWKEVVLNAAGLADISLAGTTQWGLRDERDVNNQAPVAKLHTYLDANEFGANTAELVVTYRIPYPSSSEDGTLYNSGADYTTIHDAASGTINTTVGQVGQRLSAGTHTIFRLALYFDTSALPDDATISSATLRLYVTADHSDTDFLIDLVSGSDLASILVPADYGDVVDDTIIRATELNTNTITGTGYIDLTLNTVGISEISLTGTTQFAVRSKNDCTSNAPTGNEYFEVYLSEQGMGFWPVLDIDYTTTPTVTTGYASDVTSTTATLNGYVDDAGGTTCTVWFEWGEAVSYGYSTATQSKATGESYSSALTGLAGGLTYHFRAVGSNASGTSYGVDHEFTALIYAPTAITNPATAVGANTATLEGNLYYDGGSTCEYRFLWGEISYSNPDNYPYSTLWTSGIVESDDFSEVVPGLTKGTTYYFRAQVRNSYSDDVGNELTFTTTVANPSITTVAAANVSTTTAELRAYLDGDGGEQCYVRLQYGTTGQQYSTGDDATTNVYGVEGVGEIRAQTFTIGVSNFTVDAVGVKAYRVGSPGTLTASVRAVDGGGQPVGADLTTGTIDADTFTITTSGVWYHIDVTNFALTAATEYALVLVAAAGGVTDKVVWLIDETAPGYGGAGNSLETKSGAGAWVTEAGDDCMFGIWSDYTSLSWIYGYTTGNNISEVQGGLSASTVYRFRAQVYNSANGVGAPVSGSVLIFVTESAVGAPSNLAVVTTTSMSISLSWTRGTGAYRTKVMYKIGAYPTDYADGTTGYFDTGTSTTITGLEMGTTYYIGAWGESSSNWSGSNVEVLATTQPGEEEVVGPWSIPEEPDNWFTAASGARLVNLPGYTIVTDSAERLGMDSGPLFFLLSVILAVGAGFAAYVFSHSLPITLVATGTALLGGLFAGTVPGWVFFLYLVLGVALGYLFTRQVTI